MNTQVLSLVLSSTFAFGLHEHNSSNRLKSDGNCVYPGLCSQPPAKFSRIIRGPSPGVQWNWDGGFCGAWSIQQSALAFGAWISQDLIRKANRNESFPRHMHGNSMLGYEVVPVNVAVTAKNLKLDYLEFNYTQPKPQADAYKIWVKSNLVQGHPVVFFPMCKGDHHLPYPESDPNGGHFDHVEPMFGIFSNQSLDDEKVYDDDYIVHASDQDYLPYFRKLSKMQDSTKMDGNCKNAQPGFGKNEMYPCFDEQVAYGLAITGLADESGKNSQRLSVSITVNISHEPNVRFFEMPVKIQANVSVETKGIEKGTRCVLYSYDSTEDVPTTPPYDKGYEFMKRFESDGSDNYIFVDPNLFLTNSARYYVAVIESTSAVMEL